VMGDGSARRSLKAPGYLDPRAAAFDADVKQAVRTGDLGALLRLDQALARDLMATGRPAWQVLAGAMGELVPVTEVLYCGDPFGVAYLVACLQPGSARSLARTEKSGEDGKSNEDRKSGKSAAGLDSCAAGRVRSAAQSALTGRLPGLTVRSWPGGLVRTPGLTPLTIAAAGACLVKRSRPPTVGCGNGGRRGGRGGRGAAGAETLEKHDRGEPGVSPRARHDQANALGWVGSGQ